MVDVGDLRDRSRILTSLGVVAGYGLAGSVFIAIAADRLISAPHRGAGLRAFCVLGTVAVLVVGAGVIGGVRRGRGSPRRH